MVFCESGHDLWRIRTVFLRISAVCYAMAFASIYPQISGLYGHNGLLPIHGLLDPAPALTKNDIYEPGKILQLFKSRPTLLWLHGMLGLSPDLMMDVISLAGMALALMAAVWPNIGNKLAFIALWVFYQSLYQVGQTFMWFQWDILLLEVGFLCILVAPWRGRQYFMARPYDHINLMLVRWLLFRMMFASGAVKLISKCPTCTEGSDPTVTWWGLTALPTHYESQCLPTPLAWYAFQLPDFAQKLSVAGTFFIEIGLVFLFFAPSAGLRKFTAIFQVFLMVSIMLTGNYNFFNLLYIGLCTSLADDSWIKTKFHAIYDSSKLVLRVAKLFNVVAYIGIGYLSYRYLLHVSLDPFRIEPLVKFSQAEFDAFLEDATLIGITFGGLALMFSGLMALFKCLHPMDELYRSQSSLQKCVAFINCGLYAVIAGSMFIMSIPVFAQGLGQKVPDLMPTLPFNHVVSDYNLINSYGLFRRMTGVGGRPEIVIEGADQLAGPWTEYHFMYKPGNVSEAPKFLLPHQPRLDWQMWFAALGKYQQNPWFISLLYRILEGKKEAMALLDTKVNPKKAPKFIRSKLYKYHFAKDGNNWWTREEAREYTPVMTLDDPPQFAEYLTKMGVLTPPKKSQKSTNRWLAKFLQFLRSQARNIPHHYLVWSVSWPIILIFFM